MPAQIILLVVGGILFYRIGDHEYGAGFVPAGLSILLGIITGSSSGGAATAIWRVSSCSLAD
ncbi:MAG: hypothetical protein IPO52_15940 [Gemmatimonadetes bacterium]|nr:hypothetical protein [Gemmatimonadota bacterium]